MNLYIAPAYDLLSTKLMMPKDKEDLALTLNGKKNNFRKKDFDFFGNKLGINETALNNIYTKFEKTYPELNELINKSFLSQEMKEKYAQLLTERTGIIF